MLLIRLKSCALFALEQNNRLGQNREFSKVWLIRRKEFLLLYKTELLQTIMLFLESVRSSFFENGKVRVLMFAKYKDGAEWILPARAF